MSLEQCCGHIKIANTLLTILLKKYLLKLFVLALGLSTCKHHDSNGVCITNFTYQPV